MSTRLHASAAAILLLGATATPILAQNTLTSGVYDFTGSFGEFGIPDLRGSIFTYTLLGGDGGRAAAGENGQCWNGGGQGATATMSLVIGDGPGQLRPRGEIRYIVGQQGGDGNRFVSLNEVSAAGAGGGGSGLFYRPRLGEDLILLSAAGGGGGGQVSRVFQICFFPDRDGDNAQVGTCGSGGDGSDAGAGGCAGQAGETVTSGSGGSGGGGGGWLGPIPGPDVQPEAGAAGGTTGGPGGVGTGAIGGWGFGGGGGGNLKTASDDAAAGGGGGYSGGGGGDGNHGGGGGSFVNPEFGIARSVVADSPGMGNGQFRYAVTGQVHDERENALRITRGQTTIKGSTLGTVPTFSTGCQSFLNNDVWYLYTNEDPIVETVTFTARSGVVDMALLRPAGGCITADFSTVSVVLGQFDGVLLSVASASDTFEIDVTYETLPDSDGDGIPDDEDICPTIDDSTLTPEQLAADVDNDGIPDVCDQLCPEDVVPDGVIDDTDLVFISFVIGFGGGDEAAQLDLDGNGVFDFFDWADYIDGCE